MDGRVVVHGNQTEGVDDEEAIGRGREEGTSTSAFPTDQDAGDDTGREMILSRDEFELLLAFHRVIPLPALSSNILRVLVDEDLQVPDAAPFNELEATAATGRSEMMVMMMEESDQTRNSPLTRRLSKRGGGEGTGRPGKPHFEVDLSTRTAKQDQARVCTFAASALGPTSDCKARK